MRTTMFGLVFVLISGLAFAQQTVMIDDMTGTEVMEAIAGGKTPTAPLHWTFFPRIRE
jgi:hypothetical protein